MARDRRRIDTHQHLIPPGYMDRMREKGVRMNDMPPLDDWSPEKAVRLMDGRHIQAGILSPPVPGVYFGDVEEARRSAREVNEYAAEVVARRPDRFGFFAMLPLPDVNGAITEAIYALDILKADGVLLLANYDARYPGDPGFDPLLRFLHQRQAVVFIHPGVLPGPEVPDIPMFTADFLLDTTRAAISLILSGALKKYPAIKFMLAHAGGFVPYIAYRILLTMLQKQSRLQQVRTVLDQKRQVPELLGVLRQFYYDVALSATPTTFPSLLEVASPDHITYGTDFPFAPAVAVRFMTKQYEQCRLDKSLRDAIDRGNAEALFPRLKA